MNAHTSLQAALLLLLVQAKIDLQGATQEFSHTHKKRAVSMVNFYLERKVFELLQALPDVRSHPAGRRHVVLGLQGGDTQSQPVSGGSRGLRVQLREHSLSTALRQQLLLLLLLDSSTHTSPQTSHAAV